ncbi:MAG: 3-ketoacyl-ACP reductase [Gemmatimonadales bacterium]|nr:3-ketoacyl-ACP reductase [Gemmatimonadales bacterium]NIN10472.1 3-ketoacyl-ACP reductase [Gemmatimonadales bacterium]NIQ98932.1 3-ketoacyl-ACP reductase [Gemmatimonadales bacterium]NIS63760.1 3-ketoacyl-ACP reductase [Gemmatimonadales bacterium]
MSRRPCAVVTGASRGIGRAIAIGLAEAGYDIVANARSYNPDDLSRGLAETGERVMELGAAFHPAAADIADLTTHERLLRSAIDRFSGVDLLVNNAGIGTRVDFLETTPENLDRVVGVNLRGAFFLTQCFARHMVERAERGEAIRPAIVFITSISADTSSPTRAEYCVSKAGLSQLAQICAHRLAQHGVNVYEVRPGIIETDMTAPVKQRYDALIDEGVVPQRRWGTPRDVARAVAALARGDFEYSTGGVFEVSGGMNIKRL